MLDRKILGYDFEVYSKINWWCVTFEDKNTGDITKIINDRDEFIKFYQDNRDAIYVGYNSRHYDQWIFKGILAGVNPSKINDELIYNDRKGYQLIRNARNYPLNNYDVMLKDKGLKLLEAYMGHTIVETSVPFDTTTPLTEDEIKEIVKYNVHDVRETLSVLEYTMGDFEAHLAVVEMFDLDMVMFNNSKAQLSSHVMGAVKDRTLDDEFEITIPSKLRIPAKYQHVVDWIKNPANMSYKLPLKSEDRQNARQLNTLIGKIPCVIGYGGIHASQDNSLFKGILLCCDVASLYPALMINEKYLSRKVVNPEKFREIRDRRMELKKIRDKRQQPLKIVIMLIVTNKYSFNS